MDAKSRQIIGFYVGDRSRKSARKLWGHIPKAYRQQATFYTDQYGVLCRCHSRCAAPTHRQVGP
jgi:hypothetical protein